MFNVDGGYLTFKMAFGSFSSWQMKYGHNVSIFAVDNKPKRRELYADYKKGRNTGKDEILETVWALRREIETDRLLPLCSIEGLEADDIVACWNLFNPYEKIVGVDKDFFQLPEVEYVYYHNIKPYSVIQTIGKLPQYVQPIASRNFALYQILFGDVADNIPRLLAKGKDGKEQLNYLLNILHTPTYYKKALSKSLLDIFGDKVVTNAALVLLPYYEYINACDWFDCWCSGHYHDKENWTRLYQQIKDCTLPNRVTQDREVWELFSLE